MEVGDREPGRPEREGRTIFVVGNSRSGTTMMRIVNMVREPRDVLLSQKRKWKRRFLRA